MISGRHGEIHKFDLTKNLSLSFEFFFKVSLLGIFCYFTNSTKKTFLTELNPEFAVLEYQNFYRFLIFWEKFS